MKLYYTVSVWMLALLIGFTTLVACEDELMPPPPLNIVESDATGTKGELTVNVYYRHGLTLGKVSPAPSETWIYVFPSQDAYWNWTPVYQTYTYIENSCYFGFLPPGEYPVETQATINGTEYAGRAAAIVVAQEHFHLDVYMEPVPAPQ